MAVGKDFVNDVHRLALGVLGQRDFCIALSVQHLAGDGNILSQSPLLYQQAQRCETAGTRNNLVFVALFRPSDSEVWMRPCASMLSASSEMPTSAFMRRTLALLGTSRESGMFSAACWMVITRAAHRFQ
ncbi:hypothetical protein [Rhizobium leguminosarum]